jgi:Na+-transporting methylmalonyl-CoA/oxaloacetate decarboxylase gamma subunit
MIDTLIVFIILAAACLSLACIIWGIGELIFRLIDWLDQPTKTPHDLKNLGRKS